MKILALTHTLQLDIQKRHERSAGQLENGTTWGLTIFSIHVNDRVILGESISGLKHLNMNENITTYF